VALAGCGPVPPPGNRRARSRPARRMSYTVGWSWRQPPGPLPMAGRVFRSPAAAPAVSPQALTANI